MASGRADPPRYASEPHPSLGRPMASPRPLPRRGPPRRALARPTPAAAQGRAPAALRPAKSQAPTPVLTCPAGPRAAPPTHTHPGHAESLEASGAARRGKAHGTGPAGGPGPAPARAARISRRRASGMRASVLRSGEHARAGTRACPVPVCLMAGRAALRTGVHGGPAGDAHVGPAHAESAGGPVKPFHGLQRRLATSSVRRGALSGLRVRLRPLARLGPPPAVRPIIVEVLFKFTVLPVTPKSVQSSIDTCRSMLAPPVSAQSAFAL